jgi:hypothetical protein
VAVDENGLRLPSRETVALVFRLFSALCVIGLGLMKDGVQRVVITLVGIALVVVWVWLARRAPSRP